jgi:hypothetical protein
MWYEKRGAFLNWEKAALSPPLERCAFNGKTPSGAASVPAPEWGKIERSEILEGVAAHPQHRPLPGSGAV